MNASDLNKMKKQMGKKSFNAFFPNSNNKRTPKAKTPKISNLLLVEVPEGKQTLASSFVKSFTGWTVKTSTAFVKEGGFPKVVISNVKVNNSLLEGIDEALVSNIIFVIE